ncbi:cytochrome P450 [Poronia punctata]|nr:cytochrome P450 [Poronia punctata]
MVEHGNRKSGKAHRHALRRLQVHRAVADFSAFKAETVQYRLELRANPNARLIRAFGLENSFTTTDPYVHTEFVRKAKKAIQTAGTEEWIMLGDDTKKLIHRCLSHFENERPYIPLAHLIRVVSFGLISSKLFSIDPSKMDIDDATTATEAINRLWAQSKERDAVPSLYDIELLYNALRRVLPIPGPFSGTENPLNLIMPAYETLWRVVLLTFVSVTDINIDPITRHRLQQALDCVPKCLQQNNEAEKNALAIAKEGLRLYPPTKRIYRAQTNTCDEERADVEACHRSPEIWGPDALEFKPMRFYGQAELTLDQRSSYFPFGVGSHMCPAAAGFGERIITLLVVELARISLARGIAGIHLGNARAHEGQTGLLPTGRCDMESWTLELDQH